MLAVNIVKKDSQRSEKTLIHIWALATDFVPQDIFAYVGPASYQKNVIFLLVIVNT